ncbi:MAG: c(7)-type cytochrome triheme domain-containing protein [Nitrospinota bacterium]
MRDKKIQLILSILLTPCLYLIFPGGCTKLTPVAKIDREDNPVVKAAPGVARYPVNFEQLYYEKFYQQVTERWNLLPGTTAIADIDGLPKDPYGLVNWTGAVLDGFIHPLGSLDLDKAEEPPLMLNIFIEAKVPLMFNVVFPHSIHTYWLSCENCHPSIFVDKAGANPITMNEIFQGKWCGRCHNKVSFPFWPKSNCNRCHVVPKGMSLEREKF